MKLFVYGTLRPGGYNHYLLEEALHLGPAVTEPEFDLVDLGSYPAMVPGGETAVVGDLFEIDEALLRRCDRLEGHPDFYYRTTVTLSGNEEALTYLMLPEKVTERPRIPSGDWFNP